jgi:hypothetical protein
MRMSERIVVNVVSGKVERRPVVQSEVDASVAAREAERVALEARERALTPAAKLARIGLTADELRALVAG